MQKIVPHLWFDSKAKEATEFYTSLFPESKITSCEVIHDTPSGDCEMLSFDLWGQSFMAISAGPYFKLNPSISLMVNFDPSKGSDSKEHLDRVWEKLIEGGKIMMPLGEYPFSKHYGWVEDKYGLSWQLILTNPEGEERPTIIPSLMFVGENCGKAEQATNFYLSIFKNTKRGTIARYPEDSKLDKPGTIMFTDVLLDGSWIIAMDSAYDHKFQFNEAISFIVKCDNQEEIDYYWEKLSAHPKAERCGWLKDIYGVSWQITPRLMDEMMGKGTPEQRARVTKAFLQMKKFDITQLQNAYDGK